jgi:hypothetical protein
MTITWTRKHWVVFAVLLLCQAVGFWGLTRAGAIDVRADGFALRAHFGWLFLPGYIFGSAFTALILVSLYESVVPKGTSRKSVLVLFLFWLICVVAGFLMWHLIK